MKITKKVVKNGIIVIIIIIIIIILKIINSVHLLISLYISLPRPSQSQPTLYNH